MQSIQKEIKQFLRKEWFQKAYMDSNNVTSACRPIRKKYVNVDIAPKPGGDVKIYLVIKVKRFFTDGKMKYETKVKGKSIYTHNPKDSLSWPYRF